MQPVSLMVHRDPREEPDVEVGQYRRRIEMWQSGPGQQGTNVRQLG